MQLRYLGDSHDFIKFALLRHLHDTLKVRLGVNWYLTCPNDVDRPNNQDGGQRYHMTGDEWRRWNENLFVEIDRFQEPKSRTFENFHQSRILPPNTLYHEDQLKTTDDRSLWHKEAMDALSHSELIFLDTDNGFEVSSWTKRTKPKYATYAEARNYYALGKIVVAIQFARQCDPVKRGKQIRDKLIPCSNCSTKLPILRGHVAPNILFFTISPLNRVQAVKEALESFAAQSPIFGKDAKTKKVVNRVELIL
jgi:hypothetical protein